MENKIKLIFRLICYYTPFLRSFLECPIELSIIRHAQSERNLLTRKWQFSGTPDQRDLLKLPDHKVNLTEKGKKQAEDSGSGITNEIKPDIIITSGYARTIQTLAGIKSTSNAWDKIPVKEDLMIRERETGYTWSMLDTPHHEVFPFLPEYWQQHGNFLARPVGGHSILDMIESRLYRFIEKMGKKYAGKKVCLVAHGRVVAALRFVLEDMTLEEAEDLVDRNSHNGGPKNVGLTVYRYNPWSGRLELAFYNKTFY